MGVLHIRDASTKKFVPITTINGITPHIGENKNWWIGDTDTGIRAQGTVTSEGGGTVTGIKIGETIYEPDASGTIELSDMELGSGDGTVKSINGVEADEYGEISLCLSDVKPDDNSAAYGEVVFIPVKSDDSNKLGGVEADKYALKTDTAPNAEKFGDKAPEYYLQPRNLLDNSNFKDFIAQAGILGYHGNERYLGDRWYATNSVISAEKSPDGLFVTGSNSGSYFGQRLYLTPGKTYTLAAKGNVESALVSAWDIATDTMIGRWSGRLDGIACAQFTPTDEYVQMLFYTGFSRDNGGTGTWEWIALYEGEYTADNLPPYAPKGYTVELAECQMYHWAGEISGHKYHYSSGVNYFTFPALYPQKMKAKPTPVIKDINLNFIGSISNEGVNISANFDRIDFVSVVGTEYEQGQAIVLTLELNSDL